MTIVHRHYNFNFAGHDRSIVTNYFGRPEMADANVNISMTSLETTDRESAAVQQTPNRVTLDSMKAKITGEEYWHPDSVPHMTVCALKVENGYVLIGKSAPADADNFNAALGRKFAYEDALRQMWALEGYLLRERLSL
jgi:glutamate synthase domain-containing protein 2